MAKPVQDQVYNAIQEISVTKRYDVVFDKSSDLIMLYTNRKFDISELVLNRIVKNRKRKVIDDRKNNQIAETGGVVPANEQLEEIDAVEADSEFESGEEETITEEKSKEQQKIDDRIAKREALKEKIKLQQEARIRVRDSLRKVADDNRAAKLKEIEDRRKAREEQIDNN